MLDASDTLGADAGKGGRANGKETIRMARRRYQIGCLFIRGKRRKVWVARWREDVLRPDGTPGRVLRSEVIGLVAEIPTRREARKLLDARLRPINQGFRKAQATITFLDFARTWEEAVLPAYRESTCYFYRNVLHKHLLPYFGGSRLCEIQTPEVQTFMNQKAQQYAPSVLHHVRATLSRVLRSAKEWGYMDSNPTEGVRLPHKQTIHPRDAFGPADVQRILAKLDEPYRSMVVVAALTGMRASELFAFTWEDVDFERGLIHVRRTFYRGQFGPPKNRTSERAIPTSPVLSEVLQSHRQQSRPNSLGLVFANTSGKPYDPGNLVQRVLQPVLKALGLPPAGWRAFRRSLATALSELREPVRTAQQVLGHSSPHTTLAFYTQSAEESQRSALNKLEGVMFPNVPKLGEGPQAKSLKELAGRPGLEPG